MLRLENVQSGYGTVQVLRGVSLRVPAGSAVALLGANGAGKTTLLRTAAGVIQPTNGHIWFDGIAVEREPYHRRAQRGLCLIPEGRGIFRDLTVRENIAMFSGDTMKTSDAVDLAVDAFPALKARLGQPAGQLSGGQQQMLAVTRALLPETKVILADELSVGLAPVIIDEIFDVVSSLKATGRSLLIVEQYVDRVLEVADYVYILHKGQVVFVGEPEQCLKTEIFDQYVGAAHS
ncbi:MAG TPA: ABC transporter ATP-binding protein [Acidimicrobiia bacterium]|nr:ABC transporter ATP-binding protein [Acidimicrobiia bacterium]